MNKIDKMKKYQRRLLKKAICHDFLQEELKDILSQSGSECISEIEAKQIREHIEVGNIETLIELGADPSDIRLENDMTPLEFARTINYEKLIELFTPNLQKK